MNLDNSSHQQQFQSFGDISAEGNAQVVIRQISQTYQVIAREDVKERQLIQASPYIGLKKFEFKDQDLFFGREQWIAKSIEAVGASHLILLLGASGSGKSSLIRAGLIPKLTKSLRNPLVELVLTPDRDPFESFRSVLIAKGYSQDETAAILQQQPSKFDQAIKALKKDAEQWLIFIDQFEQLFTRCQDTALQKRFIDSITGLVNRQNPSIKVVLAMRADFLDKLSPYPKLTKHQLFLHDMQPDELRLAIEQPAAQHGVVFEEGLVEEIISDVQGQARLQPGSLPLLQYTLDLLWQRSDISSRTLRTETYRVGGTVRDALQKRVDEIYTSFSPSERAAAKQIFLKLVDINNLAKESEATSRVISRRAYRSEFGSALAKTTLDKLVNNNLLVTSREQQATVELAHEVLINSWSTLKGWIEESREAIILRNRLADDAQRWQTLQKENHAHAEEELWSGSKLERVLELKQERMFEFQFGGLSSEQEQFITASADKRDQELKRAKRRATVALSALLFVTGLTLFSGVQWLRAERGQILALSEASDALFSSNRDSLEPLLKALEAGQKLKRIRWLPGNLEILNRVMEVLPQAVYWVQEKNRLEGHNKTVESVSFSPDSTLIATAGYDQEIQIWNRQGEKQQRLVAHKGAIRGLAFSQNSQWLASASLDKNVMVWSPYNKSPIKKLPHSNFTYSVSFKGNDIIATGDDKGYIELWDWKQQKSLRRIKAHNDRVLSLSFSPNGAVLASASKDTTVKIFDVSIKNKVLNLKEHPQPLSHQDLIYSLAFSPNGQLLATASKDTTVKFWKKIGREFQHSGQGNGNQAFTSVSFSPDSAIVAAGTQNGQVQMWDTKGQNLATIQSHNSRVNSVSFSPEKEGYVLASASNDKTLKLWQLNPSIIRHLKVSHKAIYDISFSPDGEIIASSGDERIARLWKWRLEETPYLSFPAHKEAIDEIIFSSQEKLVATTSRDNHVKLWDWKGQPKGSFFRESLQGASSISFNPATNTLAIVDTKGTVTLWNTNQNKKISFPAHKEHIFRVRFSPYGNFIATASDDGTARLWKSSGEFQCEFKGHKARVWDVAFSPLSNRIATTSKDHNIKMWNHQCKLLHTLKGHSEQIIQGSFSPNGKILATASDDRAIKLWTQDGILIATLRGHEAAINSVSFHPKNNNILASGSSDGTIIVWNLENLTLDGLMIRGCNWIQDYLESKSTVPKFICDKVN